jgi:hypothetical protein
MSYKIVREKISKEERKAFEESDGDFAKVAVDTARGILSIGCELHIDCYEKLIEDGSRPGETWGANVYFDDESIEYTSMVNIRPPENSSMEITNPAIREKVKEVINRLLF